MSQKVIAITINDSDLDPSTKVFVYNKKTSDDGRLVLEYLGSGVYEGDYPITGGYEGEPLQTVDEKVAYFLTYGSLATSRIQMDSGQVLWGNMVFFYTEEEVADLTKIADEIVDADLDSFIKEYYDAATKDMEVARTKETLPKNVTMTTKPLFTDPGDSELPDFWDTAVADSKKYLN